MRILTVPIPEIVVRSPCRSSPSIWADFLPRRTTLYDIESRLTPEQAAKVRGISLSKLNKDRCFGGGPPFEKAGRTVRYRYGTLLAWMAAQTRQSTSDDGKAA
jgi:hypothetical protein